MRQLGCPQGINFIILMFYYNYLNRHTSVLFKSLVLQANLRYFLFVRYFQGPVGLCAWIDVKQLRILMYDRHSGGDTGCSRAVAGSLTVFLLHVA